MKIKSPIVCDCCGVLIGKPGGVAALYQGKAQCEVNATDVIMEFCGDCYGDEKIRYIGMKKKTIENMSDEMRAKVESDA